MNENHPRMIQLWQAFQAKAESKAKADVQAARTPSSMAGGYSEAAARFEWIIEQLNPQPDSTSFVKLRHLRHS